MKNFTFNKNTDNLFRAVLTLKNISEAENFFRDLCTVDEIQEFSDRWQIVCLLEKSRTYREIAKEINVSTTTVARVAQWLNNGNGGYQLALKRLSHHTSSRPVGKGKC